VTFSMTSRDIHFHLLSFAKWGYWGVPYRHLTLPAGFPQPARTATFHPGSALIHKNTTLIAISIGHCAYLCKEFLPLLPAFFFLHKDCAKIFVD
jgi:hypothetical protein